MPQQVGASRKLEGRRVDTVLNQPRKVPVWPFAVGGSVLVLAVLAAVGTWVYGAYSMSDPVPPVLGARVEGQTSVVKVPVCPTEPLSS